MEGDPREREQQKAELIKDVLSLANGSADTAGDTAVMIVGASSDRREDGSHDVYDVGDSVPTAAQILELVRSFSSPPMDSLDVLPFRVNQTRLFALVIPPSPHVYETTKPLRSPSQAFSKYSVFIRRGDSVDVASSRERDAIKTLKRIRLSQVRNPPPMSFGGAVGATTGAILLGQIGSRKSGIEGAIGGGLAGSLLGAFVGALMGTAYEALIQQTGNRRQLPERRRGLAMGIGAASVIATWILADKVSDALLPSTRHKTGS